MTSEMEPQRRVANCWAWLPVFRAVAEAEHVRLAAERLRVSPSALSRTIKLLEDEVGRTLFLRVGRRIVLDEAGVILADAVRTAMRGIHDALVQIEQAVVQGPVTMAVTGQLAMAFVPATVDALREIAPGLRPRIVQPVPDDFADQLLAGDLDIAFTLTPVRDQPLRCEVLGKYTSGIYCGSDHPLAERDSLSFADVVTHPFVAPPLSGSVPLDGWPVEHERNTAVVATSLQMAMELTRRGQLLGVFPDAVVNAYMGADLVRLPLEVIPPISFFAVRRPALSVEGRADVVLRAMIEALGTGVQPATPPV